MISYYPCSTYVCICVCRCLSLFKLLKQTYPGWLTNIKNTSPRSRDQHGHIPGKALFWITNSLLLLYSHTADDGDSSPATSIRMLILFVRALSDLIYLFPNAWPPNSTILVDRVSIYEFGEDINMQPITTCEKILLYRHLTLREKWGTTLLTWIPKPKYGPSISYLKPSLFFRAQKRNTYLNTLHIT